MNTMSLLDAAKDLNFGVNIIYQDVKERYEFLSAINTGVSIERNPYMRLLSTDFRARQENFRLQLEGDYVFYQVPPEFLEGKLPLSEIKDSIAEQNTRLLAPELIPISGMYLNQIEDQLEKILEYYNPDPR